MSSEPNVVSLAPSSSPLGAVPRLVWIGGGLLALVTAALAGALVMRSVEPAPNLASNAAASVAAQPVPLTVAAPPAPAQVTPVPPAPVTPPAQAKAAPAKPVHQSKPTTPQPAAQAEWHPPDGTTSAVLCSSCGVVESVNAVQQKGQGTGLGAVAGGVLGGVVGHQVGGGNGKTAMTVLGAIGGGLAGNEVEKRARSETEFDIQVRMEDGNVRTFRCTQSMAVGTHVVVEGTTLRPAHAPGSGEVPRAVRTSAPAGGKT